MTDADYPVRLHVYMARCGVGSRRACERMIQEGHVEVNGEPVTRLGTKVEQADNVTVNGKQILPERHFRYLALNKPPGYICANSDPQRRPLALDLVQPHFRERLYHVGRLDLMSSGLIFFTNDGEFARKITHPSCGIEKEYIVTTRQPFTVDILEAFKRGVVADGTRYQVKDYHRISSRKARLCLEEGKNREIRNMFRHANIQVKRIHRVRIGPVVLGDVPRGAYRHLQANEVRNFLDQE